MVWQSSSIFLVSTSPFCVAVCINLFLLVHIPRCGRFTLTAKFIVATCKITATSSRPDSAQYGQAHHGWRAVVVEFHLSRGERFRDRAGPSSAGQPPRAYRRNR